MYKGTWLVFQEDGNFDTHIHAFASQSVLLRGRATGWSSSAEDSKGDLPIPEKRSSPGNAHSYPRTISPSESYLWRRKMNLALNSNEKTF